MTAPAPSTRQEMLAQSVLESRALLARYLKGFDERTLLAQGMDLPNHLAWTLGHLALTMHRAAEKIDGTPPPESDFLFGPFGDARRFGTEGVAFGSTPSTDEAHYPRQARCVEIFNAAADRLAACFRACDDQALSREVPWGATTLPAWQVATRMVFHNGTHTGQIADLRRALGMRRVLG